jgi:hypothetical protein
VSKLERGLIGHTTVATVTAVAGVLGGEVDVRLRWRGEGLDRLLDAAHAAIVERVVAMFRAAGWEVAVEVSFSIYGERGRIDVLAYQRDARALAVCEIKSVVPDSQEAIGDLDRKTRLGPRIAQARGWRPTTTARLLFVGATRTARRRIEALEGTYRTAFPVRGAGVRRWIRDPSSGPIAGLLFVSFGTHGDRSRTVSARQRVRRAKSGPIATPGGG